MQDDFKDLDALFELYNNSKDSIIKLPNGEYGVSSLKEFFQTVDFFASRYGLGGCKSLQEFADMIDKTDPVLLNGLKAVAIEVEKKKWSIDKDNINENKSSSNYIPTFNISNKSLNDNVTVSGRQNMRNFLLEFGVSKEELDKACEKLNKRKIKLKDFSWINGDVLESMSEQDFKKLLSDMSNEAKKAINFDVSEYTITEKYRKMGAGR